ncbi:MAG: hypothetical protein KDJ87_03270 [Rhizobiaceae bacterium]|nr:hypothetical protein [Rhizobiaceae bacterium]
MRLKILLSALLASAATAHAGSIDTIRTGRDTVRSIETINCTTCAPKVEKKAASVTELAPGTQKVEIRDVGGVRKVYRTEAWLGGSPVVFVSKALPEDAQAKAEDPAEKTDDVAAAPDAAADRPAIAADADMIDEKSTTAAVTADMGAEVKVKPRISTFDPGKLELRLN